MDWNTALPFIAALTQDLVLTSDTTREQLTEGQQHIARAVLNGQDVNSFGLLSTQSNANPPKVEDPSALDYLKPTFLPVTSAPSCLRRDFAIKSSMDPRVIYSIAAGQERTKSFGPFSDNFGRLIAIDVFGTMNVVIANFPNSDPYLYLTMQFEPPGTSNFGSGGMWIPARQFVASAPANSFVGLKVLKGQLENQPGPAAKLTIELAPASTMEGSASSISAPSKVSFLFRQSTRRATLVSGSSNGGSISVFGEQINLQHQQLAAVYDPVFERLNFPMKFDRSEFDVRQGQSTIARFQGKVSVLEAAWSLPAVLWSNKTFTEPSGPGGFALSLKSGLSILPVGRQNEVSCGTSILISDSGDTILGGAFATSPDKSSFINLGGQTGTSEQGDQTLIAVDRSTITFRTPKPFAFRYISQADGNESWSFLPDLSASLDQPRDVNNSRIPFAAPSYTVFTRDNRTSIIRCAVEASKTISEDRGLLSFAIRNLVFKTSRIQHLFLTGFYADNTLHTGAVSLSALLHYTLPMLPDPYATNISFDPGAAMEDGLLGPLQFKLLWTPETDLDIDISFPPSFDIREHINIELSADPKNLRNFNDILGSIGKSYGISLSDGPVLLDLSTNASQLGIALRPRPVLQFSTSSAATSLSHYTVSELALQSPLQDLRVFALPAVQWEPITLLDANDISSPVTYEFSYAGPATKLQSNSTSLTPLMPQEAIDQVISTHNEGTSSELVTLFSLPFGIVAVVNALGSSNDLQQSPEVNHERPTFNPLILSTESDPANSGMPLAGSNQISIKARNLAQASNGLNAFPTSPSLSGAAVPLFMDLNHSSNARSVLGPIIPGVFQDRFRTTVPLTRIDISGYGESVFSNWHTEVPLQEAGVSKVYFDVFSGRTAREVVEMTSVLFPYMVRVVRMISIERANSGIVFRRDSGWQAVSDGNYKIAGSDIETHPGIVLGVSNVTNIRDVNSTTGDMVRFDCTIRLEDGEGFLEVLARDQLGFIVTGTTNTTPTTAGAPQRNVPLPSRRDYAWKLLELPLGGDIDAVVTLGKSGLKTRITSVSVAPCRKDGQNPVQFAMAAWGSPILPGGGQWSLTKNLLDGTVQAVDSLKGVPIVRQGLDPISIAPDIPYHFADPTDLLKLADPGDRANAVRGTVYSILHATDSYRMLFPDPALDQVKKGLRSLRAPVLADMFALGTSTGIFPKIANCIPLPNIPDEAQLLKLVGSSDLLFDPGRIPLQNLSRELQKDGNVASLIELTQNSELNVVIDTVKQVQSLDLKNVAMVAQNITKSAEAEVRKEANRVIGDIKSAVGKELTKFVNSNHIFGEALQEVKKVVSFLDTLGILPPLKVSMTNEWALEISTGMGLKEFLEKIHDPATKALMTKFIQDFELAISARSTLHEAKFKLKMHVTIKVDSGFGLMALGVAGFDLGLSTATGLSLSLDLGVGIGITFTVGPFGASAYYSQTQTIMKSKETWGVGATAVVKAHVDLVVATADLCLEAKLMLISGTCHDHEVETTIWAWAQVSIALDISIFWVVNPRHDRGPGTEISQEKIVCHNDYGTSSDSTFKNRNVQIRDDSAQRRTSTSAELNTKCAGHKLLAGFSHIGNLARPPRPALYQPLLVLDGVPYQDAPVSVGVLRAVAPSILQPYSTLLRTTSKTQRLSTSPPNLAIGFAVKMGDTPSLVVLPYLQGWDGSHLSVRILLIPRGNPFSPLDPNIVDSPSFPTANLKFDVHLLDSLETLPSLSSGTVIHSLTFDAQPTALKLFKGILAQLTSAGLEIDPSPPGAGRVQGASLSVYKHLPASYRDAVGTVSQSKLFPAGKQYSCMLKERTVPSQYVKLPEASKKIAWGRLITGLLRNPKLAEGAGLIHPASIPISPQLLENGAFIFLTIAASSDTPKLPLKTFAARISTMKAPQDLFSPVFFPVKDPRLPSTPAPLSDYVNIFAEAEDYDDGWAKAVHCAQPQQLDPMKHEPDGTRPVGELGIRIGWDDEQITTWLDRQMDPANISIDSPLGVQGYRIDVQKRDSTAWHSLVRAQGPCIINGETYAQYDGNKDELGVEVHPSQQLDTDNKAVFWLPIYFATWSGPSLVTMDNDRIRLTGGKDRSQETQVKGVRPDVQLKYGSFYTFRVRLMDHTGGGPTIDGSPSNPSLSPTSEILFRRWVRPLAPVFVSEIPTLSEDLGAESAPSSMEVRRPNLSYPAVICTGYYSNPVEMLLQDLKATKLRPPAEWREPSLPDPDIDRIEITVWISTLAQDPLATDGVYMKLYTTNRKFPANVDQSLIVSFSFMEVLNVFEPDELPQGWDSSANTGPLLLPKSRTIRLKVAALCKDDPGLEYFGAEDVRRSVPVLLSLRQNSSSEANLLIEETESKAFNAYFLQQDAPETPVSQAVKKVTGDKNEGPPDIASRLATVVGLRNKGMTMCSMPGERIVFACSGAIRHTLGPDRATVSFATQVDISLRWITVIRLILNRDWTWDGLAPGGIRVARDEREILRFAPNANVNHDALLAPGPDRGTTTLVIFDAIDPDPGISNHPNELHPRYTVSYALMGRPETELTTREFKIDLPVTSVPRQIPKIVSSGIAMSPYTPSDDYSATNVRQKVLWIEFDEQVHDPRDNYFCRVLRNVPDPLIGNSPGDKGTPEPALPIPLETTLRVIPNQANDWSGLDAMQPLSKSTSSNRHFAVPLPAGMSPSSPELFGFFTYEFRIGHADPTMWTTAQGRFGPPLRCTGIQHPAPQLTCSISRSDKVITVSAPSAISVQDGVDATPTFERPRMFILLYAQAFQITSAASRNMKSSPTKRNILLFTREGSFGSWSWGWAPGVVSDPWAPPGDPSGGGTPMQPSFPGPANMPKKYATATFSVDEVDRALDGLGLWRSTPLSVLAAEMLPQEKDSVKQPLGADIGRQRILRTSILCAVPSRC